MQLLLTLTNITKQLHDNNLIRLNIARVYHAACTHQCSWNMSIHVMVSITIPKVLLIFQLCARSGMYQVVLIYAYRCTCMLTHTGVRVCWHVQVYMYVDTYRCACMLTCTGVHVCWHVQVHMYVDMYRCTCMLTHTYVHVCWHIQVYVYVDMYRYVCWHVQVYMYVDTYTCTCMLA